MAALSMDGIPMTALPNSADQITFDNTGTGMSATMVDTAIKELKTDKAETDIVAADFNPLSSYTAGNYCIHEGKFYKFKNNHSGAWSASDVDEIKIAGELSTLKSGLTNVQTNLTDLLNNMKVVSVPSGTDRKIKITRSYAKQYFFVMSNNNYHPFFGIISQLDGATDHLQAVPANPGVTASLTDNTFELTLISYFGGLTIISNADFTVTAEPVT